MILQNPTDGVAAKVFANQHLAVKAIDEPIIGYKSKKEEAAFSLHTPVVWTISTTPLSCMVLKNNETEKNFIINKIYIGHNGGTTNNTAHLIATMYKETGIPTTNIYASTAIPFGNLNMSSSKVTTVVGYIWDGTSTGLDGAKGSLAMNGIFGSGFTQLDLSNSVILGPSQTVRIDLTSLDETDVRATISISGFLDDGITL